MTTTLTRSTKFTEETRAVVLAGIAAGMTLGNAAALATISRMTLYRWVRRGEADQATGSDTELAAKARSTRTTIDYPEATSAPRFMTTRSEMSLSVLSK
jgi:transposase